MCVRACVVCVSRGEEEDEQSITHKCMPSILYSNRLKEAGSLSLIIHAAFI